MRTEKSVKYNKFRASKAKHQTKIIKGSGNAKGKLIPGSISALQEIEARLGRKLNVHHVEKNRGQWIFCELK